MFLENYFLAQNQTQQNMAPIRGVRHVCTHLSNASWSVSRLLFSTARATQYSACNVQVSPFTAKYFEPEVTRGSRQGVPVAIRPKVGQASQYRQAAELLDERGAGKRVLLAQG